MKTTLYLLLLYDQLLVNYALFCSSSQSFYWSSFPHPPADAPHAVDVALKITVFDQLCENVLFKHWHAARVEVDLLLQLPRSYSRQNHVSDAQR